MLIKYVLIIGCILNKMRFRTIENVENLFLDSIG